MIGGLPDWLKGDLKAVGEILAQINHARYRSASVDRCDGLCKALNFTWNAFFTYRKKHNMLTEEERKKRSDTQAFRQLFLDGLDHRDRRRFAESNSLRLLALLSPQVMNHDTLLHENYDPISIPESLRKKACEEHRQLASAYDRYQNDSTNDEKIEALLKKAQQILYVIRSNIAHCEKTPRGPDLEKVNRDRLVSEVTISVIDEWFEILLGQPSQHLAVYGTLAPGQPNSVLLDNIPGQWIDGVVEGRLNETHGLLF